MLILILGGARSGKSTLALNLARASGRDVIFFATLEPGDDEMRARIETHRAARPAAWRTVDAPRDLPGALATETAAHAFVVVDCMTVWIANELMARLGEAGDARPADVERATSRITEDVRRLLDWCDRFDGDVALVSNEVGLSVVPPYPLGRIFRDVVGAANQLAAARAGRSYFVVAGRAFDLDTLGARFVDAFTDGVAR